MTPSCRSPAADLEKTALRSKMQEVLPCCLSSAARPSSQKICFGVQPAPWRAGRFPQRSLLLVVTLPGRFCREALTRRGHESSPRSHHQCFGWVWGTRRCKEVSVLCIRNKQGSWQLSDLLLSSVVNCYCYLFIGIIIGTSRTTLCIVAHPF